MEGEQKLDELRLLSRRGELFDSVRGKEGANEVNQ